MRKFTKQDKQGNITNWVYEELDFKRGGMFGYSVEAIAQDNDDKIYIFDEFRVGEVNSFGRVDFRRCKTFSTEPEALAYFETL